MIQPNTSTVPDAISEGEIKFMITYLINERLRGNTAPPAALRFLRHLGVKGNKLENVLEATLRYASRKNLGHMRGPEFPHYYRTPPSGHYP